MYINTKAISTLVLIFLTACSTQNKLDLALQNFEATSPICTPDKLNPTNALEQRKCLDKILTEELEAQKYPYMDLVTKWNAAKFNVAAQFTQNKISELDYMVALESLEAAFQSEHANRVREASARKRLARAEALNNLSNSFQRSAEQSQQQSLYWQERTLLRNNMPKHTDCYSYGNGIRCTESNY